MSVREIITTEHAPRAVGTYSQGVCTGDLIFTAGQIPLDPETGKVLDGDFKDRVRCVLNNVDAILQEAGSSLNKAVKLTVFLRDLARFNELNEVFQEFFTEDPPARSAVEVSKLPLETDIEIECIALR